MIRTRVQRTYSVFATRFARQTVPQYREVFVTLLAFLGATFFRYRAQIRQGECGYPPATPERGMLN